MVTWFKRLYNKLVQKKVEKTLEKEPTDFTNDITDYSLWGFVVPHTKADRGAVLKSALGKVVETEYDYGAETIRLISNDLPVTKATRDGGGLKGAYGWLKIEGAKFSIEPHLNAFNTIAKGYCVLVLKGDTKSEKVARQLLAKFSEKYPDRQNRGIRFVKSGDRGALNLITAKDNGMEVALLTEMFFIDNLSDYISTKEMSKFFIDFLRTVEV